LLWPGRDRDVPICWLAMRIIAGSYRSRVIAAPRGFSTRPTSDRLRETLFNVLAGRIAGAAFLDLYSGSGAVGIEALSRGAATATFVEQAAAALKALRGNLDGLGIKSGFRVYAGSVSAFLRPSRGSGPKPIRHEVVFLDPPYDAAKEYASTLALLGGAGADATLASGALVIAEHSRRHRLDEQYGKLKRSRLLEQGDAALSFYAIECGIAET
jgi:16S rRNA (guanine966-N2)-methyltransferase